MKAKAGNVVPTSTAAFQIAEYGVYLDAQAVAYLRVGTTKKGAQFILNTAKTIELIEMEAGTIASRGLQQVPGADLLAAAKQLLTPLSKSVMVSKRAEVELQKILSNQEIIMAKAAAEATAKAPKAKAPKTVAAKSAAPTSTKAAKPAASNGAGRPSIADRQIVVLKRAVGKDEKISGQSAAILDVLKENGKKCSVPDLIAGLEGKVQSKNVLGLKDVWAMNRKKLIDAGLIEVQVKEAA